MSKKQVNIYIDEKLWKAAKKQTDNMSKLVENVIEKYIAEDNIDAIETKIKTLEIELTALNTKKIDLIRNNKDNRHDIYDELKQNYFIRKRNEKSTGLNGNDKEWIEAKPIQKKCQILGIEPLVLLKQLQKDFDDFEIKITEEMNNK